MKARIDQVHCAAGWFQNGLMALLSVSQLPGMARLVLTMQCKPVGDEQVQQGAVLRLLQYQTGSSFSCVPDLFCGPAHV